MFQIWTEREIPSSVMPMLEGIAKLLGPGGATPDHPLASASTRFDGAFMDQTPALRVISRTGIGIDNIVVPEATARGIAVCSTPDGPTISTAEHTVTLMLTVAKHVKPLARLMMEGTTKDYVSIYQGVEVYGLRLGLVGLGRIGSRVAAIASALGMTVIAYDPYVDAEQMKTLGIERSASLDTLLQTADIVSLHLPLTTDTRRLMNAQRFAQMKPGAIFVNAARGGLVDETALFDALEQGHLQSAGLDVFDKEPPPPDHPLLQRDDVVATPHIAGVTLAGRERMWRMAITNALQVLRGETPDNIVNPEVLER